MCIIASIPAGSKIEENTLNQMWNSNPDGGGIAYIEDGKVKTYKSMKLKKFRSNFMRILDEHGDSDILVHTRIATHGSVCIPNVHPFPVMQDGKELDDLVFAHNGILPSSFIPPAKMDISDTRFINEVLFNGTDFDTVLDDSRWREMIGDIIGHNKFVFLSANPAHKQESYIINSHLGEYDGKVWYSNSSYCKPKYRVVKSSSKAWNGLEPTSRSSYIDRGEDMIDTETGEIHYWEVNSDNDVIEGTYQGRLAGRIFDEGDITYNQELLKDPAFVATWKAIQANTGYQTIEHALEGLWAEIDDAGMWRCFDCDEVITVQGIRTCKSQCDVGEMMAEAAELEEVRLATEAEEEAAFAQAEADYKSANKKAKKIRKAKRQVQQKLPIKNDWEEVAPF
jgi:glutamine amidotransferase